tara:strand:+ start:368 stop:595 length:228 start_codon:yes stop_codon:yes gene_type:complete
VTFFIIPISIRRHIRRHQMVEMVVEMVVVALEVMVVAQTEVLAKEHSVVLEQVKEALVMVEQQEELPALVTQHLH